MDENICFDDIVMKFSQHSGGCDHEKLNNLSPTRTDKRKVCRTAEAFVEHWWGIHPHQCIPGCILLPPSGGKTERERV